ncbi:MAG: hypothetical protein C4521_02410 [Actinobacteria bacterium]|nr:MAG: hypothetical protein C4521_02410 [Actinomycetota bacterium]
MKGLVVLAVALLVLGILGAVAANFTVFTNTTSMGPLWLGIFSIVVAAGGLVLLLAWVLKMAAGEARAPVEADYSYSPAPIQDNAE